MMYTLTKVLLGPGESGAGIHVRLSTSPVLVGTSSVSSVCSLSLSKSAKRYTPHVP